MSDRFNPPPVDANRLAHLSTLEPTALLNELLATIHGDGGHYATAHGIAKAVADAECKWHSCSDWRTA